MTSKNERRIHLGVAALSIALIPPSVFWWSNSVPYIVALSVFAIFYAAISAHAAADDTEIMKTLERIERKIK